MTVERKPGSLIHVLGVFALLMIAFYFRATPLTPDPVRATNMPDQFDTTRAIARLARVLDGTPHPVDSPALEQTRKRLLTEISALGYVPVVHSHHSCLALPQGGMRCARVQNVFFRAGPADAPALVLTAHYDSVDASPGFGDDGIGIAVWLDVAYLLQQMPPTQPVVFLFTDGEEMNLLGARAFVDNRADYGIEVARVINLEARGVTGPALMFETSHPNAAIVRDWARNGARPFAHSMMAAVYELLPNGTDLTAHLDAGSPGINIAIAEGSDLYHSNRDELAALDSASVQHMGDQALGATRAFLASDWSADASSDEIVYADILSRLFVVLPQTTALVSLLICFCLSALLLLRPVRSASWQKPDWRALLLPPVFVAGSAVTAFTLQQLFIVLRGQAVFWPAYPQALNMTIFTAVLFVAALLVGFLAPRSGPDALFASGTFWLLLCGVIITVAVPGFAMLFLIPAAALIVCGFAGHVGPRCQKPAYAVASVLLVLHFFPDIYLAEVTLGLGNAAGFGVMEAMVLAPALALLHAITTQRRIALVCMGAVLGISSIATLVAPAYNLQHPQSMNLMANYDLDDQRALLFAAVLAGTLPAELRNEFVIGEFESPPGFPQELPARQLDYTSVRTATATVLKEEINGQGERTLRLQLDAPGARGVRLTLPAGAAPLRYRYEDEQLEVSGSVSRESVVEIVGQGVNGAIVEITVASQTKLEVLVQGMWAGLPEQAQALSALRPETSVRNRLGDQTITTRKQNL